MKYSVTALNQGARRSVATAIIIVRSADSTITNRDARQQELSLNPLAPSASFTYPYHQYSRYVTAQAPGTAYYYGACVVNDGVYENDYSNNCSEGVQLTVASGNQAPTDIALSKTDVDENVPHNTVVGTLSATDDGRANDDGSASTLSYSLRWAPGAPGLAAGRNVSRYLAISGDKLIVTNPPDAEHHIILNYPITITVSDGQYTYSKDFTITINNLSEYQPVPITNLDFFLSGLNTLHGLPENIPANSEVGRIELGHSGTTPRSEVTYSLVAGEGDTNNDDFTIIGNKLHINESPDYETNPSYSVRIQARGRINLVEITRRVPIIDLDD